MIHVGQTEQKIVAVHLLIGVRVVPVEVTFQVRVAGTDGAGAHSQVLPQIGDALRVAADQVRIVLIRNRAAILGDVDVQTGITLRNILDHIENAGGVGIKLLAGSRVETLDPVEVEGLIRIVRGALAHIVVQACKVHRHKPLIEFFLIVFGQILCQHRHLVQQRLREGALHGRLGPPVEIVVHVQTAGGVVFANALFGGDCQNGIDHADLAAQVHGLVQLHSAEVGQNTVDAGLHIFFDVPVEGREVIVKVTVVDGDLRLVEGGPQLYPVTEIFKADLGIGLKPLRKLGVGKATQVVQTLGQIPVVKAHKGGDIMLQKLIDDLVVEVDALGIHLTKAGGNDPGPGNGETVDILAGLCHVFNVGFVVVIEETAAVGQVFGEVEVPTVGFACGFLA